MNAVDRFVISYLIPEISTFKESEHQATTPPPTTATMKIRGGALLYNG